MARKKKQKKDVVVLTFKDSPTYDALREARERAEASSFVPTGRIVIKVRRP